MSDLAKTIAAVLVAALLAGVAWLTRPTPMRDASFSDQGELIAPEFTDPLAAASLEVVSFDESAGAFRPFKVEFNGARWVIPSHHNYPADAEEKMAEAAGAFIGLRKEQVVTDRAAEHQSLGVLDPDDDAAPLSGRGTRITIRDAQGRTLTSLILGKEAPAPSADQAPSKRRFIRIAGKNRVYAATLDRAFSTRFADWVETDLLQLAAAPGAAIERIAIDNYSIDESTGRRTEVQTVVLKRADAPADAAPTAPGMPPPTAREWTFDANPGGPPGPGETADTARIAGVVDALKSLRIAGVRPKPANLAAVLGGLGQQASLNQADILNLQSRGFYISQNGQLLANEGQLSAFASDGVVYTLWFGEVLFGAGEAISAGVDAAPAEGEADGASPGAGETRYMFITVSFDPAIIPEPASPLPSPTDSAPADSADESSGADETGEPADENKSPAQPEDPRAAGARLLYEQRVIERDKKLEAGRARAESLSRRFADWYYVIDASSFDDLRPKRADLIQQSEPEEAPATEPPSADDDAGEPAPDAQ